MTFDAAAYTQGERFQLERRRLFAEAWLPFCASGQLPAPGAFVTHALGGWPLVAVRGPDGVARAFRNTCRHQGMPVVETPAGSCEALRCRYHGWTFDLTGAFVSAPPLVAPSDPEAAIHHLDELTLDEAGGMILVRGRAREPAPAPRLAPGGAFAGAATTDVDANWKTVVEHLLTDPAWRFAWPIAFLGETVVRQIVPRSFSRTRVIDLRFGDAATDAAALKSGAEALQARRAAGDGAAETPAVEAFREQLFAVCGP
ncbi:MAG: Rieske (2Fe-2S) protein [Alphaproteobacteria bacterium]|nr:Rieske (2Fe-2S) protein [Alphaproteobacteria bacterium]